jgi:Xaa-Pro aminopeptidase
MIDCGAKYKGYCADITQSFWFGNKAPKEYSQAREKVKQVLKTVEQKMQKGMKVKKLWKETLCLGNLPHALGHGLGLEEHDPPGAIGEKSNWTLEEGSVVAIEPAIYNKKFGIRLEKSILMKKNGAVEL